jgi:hypothetical protein
MIVSRSLKTPEISVMEEVKPDSPDNGLRDIPLDVSDVPDVLTVIVDD